MSEPETIFALSSGAGKAGVAVIRISGPRCGTVLTRMTGGPLEPRMASLRRLVHPDTGDFLDLGLALYFPGPASFTGEDVVELQVHGGNAVRNAVLEALTAIDGCRPADSGEFTRRAFEAGKLDLSGVEGLADLINAETDVQRRLALRDASGGLASACDGWRQSLMRCLAMVEANIDFVDEQDVPEDLMSAELPALEAVLADIGYWLEDNRRGEILRAGYRVVIAGLPNVGKSSLLNRIAGRDAAIVTEIAGTTRDVIEVFLDLGGYPVVFADTAGLRSSADRVERIGIDQARGALSRAELVLWVADERGSWPEEVEGDFDSDALWVRNKADLPGARVDAGCASGAVLHVSAATGTGMTELLQEVESRAERRLQGSESFGVARARQVSCLQACSRALAEAVDLARAQGDRQELVGEALRRSLLALGRLSGRVDVEEVLDVVFGEFCIGK